MFFKWLSGRDVLVSRPQSHSHSAVRSACAPVVEAMEARQMLSATPPGGVTATQINGLSVRVNWQAAAGDDGYQVQRWDDQYQGWYNVGPVVTGGSTSFTDVDVNGSGDTGLIPGLTYQWRVMGEQATAPGADTYYDSDPSDATAPLLLALPAPSGVFATPAADGVGMDVSWDSTSDNETGFLVSRYAPGSSTPDFSTEVDGYSWGTPHAPLQHTDAFAQYTDPSPLGGVNYTYSVLPIYYDGVSSTTGDTATDSAPTAVPLAAPGNLSAAFADGGVTLQWTDNSANEQQFEVYRRRAGDSDWGTPENTAAAQAGTGSTVTLTEYPPLGSDWEYRVTAASTDGNGNVTAESAPTDPASVLALTPVGQDISATEGTDFSGTVATFQWANASESTSSFTATINWGDGTTPSTGTVTVGGDPYAPGTFVVTGGHTYSLPGSFSPVITVAYNGVSSEGSSAGASVAAASLSAVGQDFSTAAGQTFAGTVATFTDGNSSATADDFDAIIDWGDGASDVGIVVPNDSGGFDVVAAHSYDMAGSYSPSVTVYHGDMSSDPTSSTATVSGDDLQSPSNLTATMNSDGTVALNWDDNATDEDGFEVCRSSDGGDTWSEVNDPASHAGTGEMTDQDDNPPSGDIEYEVCASKDDETSDWAITTLNDSNDLKESHEDVHLRTTQTAGTMGEAKANITDGGKSAASEQLNYTATVKDGKDSFFLIRGLRPGTETSPYPGLGTSISGSTNSGVVSVDLTQIPGRAVPAAGFGILTISVTRADGSGQVRFDVKVYPPKG